MENHKLANAIRFLSIDAVQAAKSGHPGMPMGMADIAVSLWKNNLKHNPSNPKWINRDRFVLSNGHGSMLLYSLLHLTGYDLSINDLKDFRKLKSKTPGHPEYDIDIGVETTTGPLGQGIGNAFPIPCPSGPVVVSTPISISYSGWPGVFDLSFLKSFKSLMLRSYPVKCKRL